MMPIAASIRMLISATLNSDICKGKTRASDIEIRIPIYSNECGFA